MAVAIVDTNSCVVSKPCEYWGRVILISKQIIKLMLILIHDVYENVLSR